jgi:hypothetical protein
MNRGNTWAEDCRSCEKGTEASGRIESSWSSRVEVDRVPEFWSELETEGMNWNGKEVVGSLKRRNINVRHLGLIL